MEANNKTIQRWLSDVEYGALLLPRFQRKEAWSPKITERFLQAVLAGHPLGVLLVLEVDSENPPFSARPIVGTTGKGEKCRQHLLDGQQRLTALSRALKDNYEKGPTYYVEFVTDSVGTYEVKRVKRCAKSKPWVGHPVEEHDVGRLPVRLLEPTAEGRARADEWKATVCKAKGWDDAKERRLGEFITELQHTVSTTNIPFLTIPLKTPRAEAIAIFRNMNTSSVKLSAFDVANAMCEADARVSLREYVDTVREKHQILSRLEGKTTLGDLILKLICLIKEEKPRETSYELLKFDNFAELRDTIDKGLGWAEGFLIGEGFWDSRWMPSTVPLRVLPLLHDAVGKRAERKRADDLLRCYLWRSFLTDRYSRQANDRLEEDYIALRERLEQKAFEIKAGQQDLSVFDEEAYPLPTVRTILKAEWPSGKGVLKRAILAVSVRTGARGIETDQPLTRESPERDYHHVYSRNLLREKSLYAKAVNCMMLEAEANKSWGNKWPGDYLATKVKEVGGGRIGTRVIAKRLESHVLPAKLLLAAKADNGRADIRASYDEFCRERAKMIRAAMERLYRGEEHQ